MGSIVPFIRFGAGWPSGVGAGVVKQATRLVCDTTSGCRTQPSSCRALASSIGRSIVNLWILFDLDHVNGRPVYGLGTNQFWSTIVVVCSPDPGLLSRWAPARHVGLGWSMPPRHSLSSPRSLWQSQIDVQVIGLPDCQGGGNRRQTCCLLDRVVRVHCRWQQRSQDRVVPLLPKSNIHCLDQFLGSSGQSSVGRQGGSHPEPACWGSGISTLHCMPRPFPMTDVVLGVPPVVGVPMGLPPDRRRS